MCAAPRDAHTGRPRPSMHAALLYAAVVLGHGGYRHIVAGTKMLRRQQRRILSLRRIGHQLRGHALARAWPSEPALAADLLSATKMPALASWREIMRRRPGIAAYLKSDGRRAA